MMEEMNQQAEQPMEPQAEGGGSEFSEAVKQIKVPPEMQEAYQRIVVAGMKVMYAEETKQMIDEQLNADKPMAMKLAESVAGLMVILWKKSNQTMPPQMVMPAAMTLLVEAAEFLQDAGQEVTPQDVAEASTKVIEIILGKFGAKPEQIQQLFTGGFDQQAALQAGEAEKNQPPAQKGGIVGSAMQGAKP